MNVRHSSESNEHFTPFRIVEAIRASLGGTITLDPASCPHVLRSAGVPMTRPDLRALAHVFYTDPTVPLTMDPRYLETFARTVAAHERARVVADLRERGAEWDREAGTSRVPGMVARELADELEADHG